MGLWLQGVRVHDGGVEAWRLEQEAEDSHLPIASKEPGEWAGNVSMLWHLKTHPCDALPPARPHLLDLPQTVPPAENSNCHAQEPSRQPPSCFWRQGLSLNLKVSNSGTRLATESQGSSCLCSPSAAVTSTHHQLRFSPGGWGSNSGPHAWAATTLLTRPLLRY